MRATDQRVWAVAPALFLLASLGAMTPAAAQDGAGQQSPRYQLESSEQGWVRLDTVTGEISRCLETDGRFDCGNAEGELAPHDRQASRLRQRLAELEARVEALERRAADADTNDAPGSSLNGLPSDEELDEAFSLMERFLHRFMGVFRDLDDTYRAPMPDQTPESAPGESPVEPLPEKT
ncbi:hypothetical protein [Pseudohoeflea coraliihabitans]|uniref:Uncharacterized protein n=1 Tax=Pseudohoeflea coraliihabitans TaxID=2860393 RepID=A0ABS6WNA8_9HYPH|nr:hypothetical protein [Pseudohoeflea sp. DP4N28-3]MBW3097447.1 hypothetical protein [Pseudohoeflea sp. DP4N28-3]